MDTMDAEWHRTIDLIRTHGRRVAPRGMPILELDHHTVAVDMRYPVLRCADRKLNYRFMAAEALWIISGANDLASLAEHNPNMAKFSDDGVTLAGAYGPRIMSQIEYAVKKLVDDRDTRQATLTIWQPNPASSKDIPCTVAMDFKIRDEKLNLHVFMRSSDAWLGLPYDVFSFTSVAAKVLSKLNIRTFPAYATLGTLYLTAASSHLYEEHWDVPVAQNATPCAPMPDEFCEIPGAILGALKNTKKGDPLRWWESAS